MIELAPHHKYGLSLKSPLMTASGIAGYGDEYSEFIDYNLLGAFVTNPVSLRSRKASGGTRLRIHDGHLVVHTGWPNPGLKSLIQKYGNVWERFPAPVIVHLLATSPGETATAASRLSRIKGILGIELGLADHTKKERAVQLVNAAAQGDLPVIARIPFGRVDELAPLLAEEGASAVNLTAPPRAVLPPELGEEDETAKFYRGRLYGPAVYPLLLNTLSRWGRKLSIPIVACGGIQSAQQVLACLKLGATAVQIDAAVWRHPTLINAIGYEVKELVSTLANQNIVLEENDDDKNLAGYGNDIGDLLVGT